MKSPLPLVLASLASFAIGYLVRDATEPAQVSIQAPAPALVPPQVEEVTDR